MIYSPGSSTTLCRPEYHQAAASAGLGLHEYLEREAAKQQAGQHGLIALDWWNGNRSTLVDVDLTGMMMGMNLATRAPDIYRALIESTAYGTREIIDAFDAQGVAVNELVAAGRTAREECAALSNLRRCHRAPLQASGLGAGAGAGRGHARGRGGRHLQ